MVVVPPPATSSTDYVEDLVARAEAIRNRQVEPDEDNMLKITSDGRHAALDLRLVDREPDPQGGKIEVAAARIAARPPRRPGTSPTSTTTGEPAPRPGGFQIVFCDLSTPRADGEWSAYDELRRRLVAHGVPAGEIAFIHDAKTDEARARLFARCRIGTDRRAHRLHPEDGRRHQHPHPRRRPAPPRLPVAARRHRTARGPDHPPGQPERPGR